MVRKGFNRVKTGCVNCRKSHYKCDEKRPNCTRCTVQLLSCRYALDPTPTTVTLRSLLFQQPRNGVYPGGISPNRLEIDMFGMFRTDTVERVCGGFNKKFWLIDVPRAAQTYPALWHASLALTAIHQTEKNAVIASQRKQNPHYIFALTQFNKSISYLKDALTLDAITTGRLSYQQQEMILLTNLLYIGICNMLEDSTQAVLHLKNLFSLVEHVRFGQDANANPRGILNYKDLLGLLLCMDGTTEDHYEIKNRDLRLYAIPVHHYSSFTSVSEVYIAFQLTDSSILHPFDRSKFSRDALTARYIDTDVSFAQRLSDFETNNTLNNDEAQDIAVIRIYAAFNASQHKIRGCKSSTERIKHDYTKGELLDQIEAILIQQEPSTPEKSRLPLVSFYPSLRDLLGRVTSSCRVRSMFNKALTIYKKWPYKLSAIDSDWYCAFYSAKATFEAGGLARTLPMQRLPHTDNVC